LVVVEAAEKGGALITAEIANSYNKDVFAFPGSIGQTYSDGCNKLIKTNKANLLTSVRDIEYIMNWTTESGTSKRESVPTMDMSQFDSNEQKVIGFLKDKGAPMMIDELSWKSAIQPSLLASLLLNLEFKNVVQSLPGKQFKLRQ